MAITISHHAGQLQDLSEYNSDIFEYKNNDDEDVVFIKKHFDYLKSFSEGDYVYFRVSKQVIRKIKLLIIQNSDDYKVYERILNNSKNVSHEDILSNSLSRELARSIDNEILEKLRSMK